MPLLALDVRDSALENVCHSWHIRQTIADWTGPQLSPPLCLLAQLVLVKCMTEQKSQKTVQLTPDEREAVKQNLARYRAIEEPRAGGSWYWHPHAYAGIVAQGLWCYADDLVRTLPVDATRKSSAAETVRKAMIARVKSVKIFPLPILLYEIAILMDWLGEPDAADMYSSFVEEQAQFTPDEIQGIFLKVMRWDVDAALSHARSRLGLP